MSRIVRRPTSVSECAARPSSDMMPPSPSLSARITTRTYLAVTTIIRAQKISDSRPSTVPVGSPPPAAFRHWRRV